MQPTTVAGVPETWVPVERRWLGLDRRTILPAVIVILIAAIMGVALPAINRAVPNDDRVRSGDVMQVSHGVQFTPIPGWGVTSGLRAGHPAAGGSYPTAASVTDGGVAFTVRVDSYRGTARALLTKIRATTNKLKIKGTLHIDNPTRSATTLTGLPGVISRYSSTNADGIIAAFVTGNVGIEVAAVGGDGDLDAQAVQDVASMIASIRVVDRATR